MPFTRTIQPAIVALLVLLVIGPVRFAQSGSFRGVTPGVTRAAFLLDSPTWGSPDQQQIVDSSWRLWIYERADPGRIEVLLQHDLVQTIDVMPAESLAPREAVATFQLGDLIPAHRLPVDALLGPFLPRTLVFHRTSADAIVFCGASATEGSVQQIRFFRASAVEGTPPSPIRREPVRIGVNVREVTADVARRFGVAPGSGLLITSVTPGMPADEMRLRVNDILVEYDGNPIRDLASLQRILQQIGIEGRHSLEIVRSRNRAIMDIYFPETDLPGGGVAESPSMTESDLDRVAPVVEADARLSREPTPALGFLGVTPLATKEGELLSNRQWGTPRETTVVTNSLSLLHYAIKKYDVRVSVWNGRVQTLDILLPDDVRESQMVRGFGLGPRRDVRESPPESLVGTKTEPSWKAQYYQDYRVILFLEGAGEDPVARLVRFFGQPPTLDEQLAQTQPIPPSATAPPSAPPAITSSIDIKPEGRSTQKEFLNSIGMKLTRIPAGHFLRGSKESVRELAAAFGDVVTRYPFDDEQPQQTVTISRPFYMGVHEVTVGEFEQFVQAAAYRTDAERRAVGDVRTGTADRLAQEPHATWRANSTNSNAREPVIYVSWNDAAKFCQWLSSVENARYRLPTEAEWEYAARAGTTTRYASGDDPESLLRIANVLDIAAERRFATQNWKSGTRGSDGFAVLAPVGSFAPNRFGLYDMHGNVWEWCADWYDANYYRTGATHDPKGPPAGRLRVFRGGCWF